MTSKFKQSAFVCIYTHICHVQSLSGHFLVHVYTFTRGSISRMQYTCVITHDGKIEEDCK